MYPLPPPYYTLVSASHYPTISTPHHILIYPLAILLQHAPFLTSLTESSQVHTSKEGPHALWYFLQCQAKLRGYVMPGSEADKIPMPGTKQAEMVHAADMSTGEVSTQLFLIMAYPDRRHFD